MEKITKITDGAYFVPSYSEQTIVRAYSTETTIQSFGYGFEDQPARMESVAPSPLPGQVPPAIPHVRD